MTKSRQLFFGYFIAYNDSKFACKIAKKYSMRGMESIKRTKKKKKAVTTGQKRIIEENLSIWYTTLCFCVNASISVLKSLIQIDISAFYIHAERG